MPYAKIVDGRLEYAPYEIYTEDGRVIELNTREKCLENGYREVFPHNKPMHDKDKYDVVYVGFTIDEETGLIFVEYELREKEDLNAEVILNELNEIYGDEINS
jgi:hypothetical protein